MAPPVPKLFLALAVICAVTGFIYRKLKGEQWLTDDYSMPDEDSDPGDARQ